MSRGTDRRTVRVAPELWEAAQLIAYTRDESVSAVVRRALEAYINTNPRRLPKLTAGLAPESERDGIA